MSTHNMFYGKIINIILELTPNTPPEHPLHMGKQLSRTSLIRPYMYISESVFDKIWIGALGKLPMYLLEQERSR